MEGRSQDCNMGGSNGKGRSRSRRPRKRKHGGPPLQESRLRWKEFDDEARESALSRFQRSEKPMAFPSNDLKPNLVEISWPTRPVPLETEAEAIGIVVKRGEWGWLSDEQVKAISNRIEDKPMSLDQALSLRSAVLQEKSVHGFHKLQGRSIQMKKLYDGGEDVVVLSRQHDFPPMNLFRAILKARGWSKTRIKEALRNPEKGLDERDREQFKAAELADRVSNVDQSETQERAETFEDVLCNFFDSKDVSYRRHEEMVSEQMAEHGRPVRTPDLLLLDDVRIDGEPVSWVDAKHYYGADVSFQRKKTMKQMARYVEEWGQGAIVFRHGFCANLHIPGTILLDASPLDLSPLERND